MKLFVHDPRKPLIRSLAELKARCRAFWDTLNATTCTTYIEHLYRVVPAIVVAEGGHSGH